MSELLPAKRKPGLVDLCPICVFLLESEEGEILFEQNMIADVHMERGTISSVGWHCRMCGASGMGEIPQFHEKPKAQRLRAGKNIP
jgi:hypothetical protein